MYFYLQLWEVLKRNVKSKKHGRLFDGKLLRALKFNPMSVIFEVLMLTSYCTIRHKVFLFDLGPRKMFFFKWYISVLRVNLVPRVSHLTVTLKPRVILCNTLSRNGKNISLYYVIGLANFRLLFNLQLIRSPTARGSGTQLFCHGGPCKMQKFTSKKTECHLIVTASSVVQYLQKQNIGPAVEKSDWLTLALCT